MSYQVIARKWRPQTFDDIVGQEHVTQTLRNSIATGRVGHAFLFTGIRGVGKTTAARVLAKALNCVNGPTADPCNKCPACNEITSGISIDVKEVDGASNRGIDSIRDLREGVAFAPARDRNKVYIIDEVHMLTTEAFNALLKTLEEPPPHVVFIFATTELHKVPATIASRCQVFEFKRIAVPALVARLGMIVSAEGVQVGEDALRLVAREADGSLRDACSLMDQVISFASGPIEATDVAQILRTGDRAVLHRTLAAVVGDDPAEALRALDEALQRGMPARQFLRDLARFLSDCMKVGLLGPDAARETGLTEAEIGEMSAIASRHPPEYLASLLHLLVIAADKTADSRSPDLLAQAAIVKATRLAALSAVDGMISRLEAVASGSPQSAPAPRVSGPRAAPAPAPVAAVPRAVPRPAPAPAPRPAPVRPAPAGPAGAAMDRLAQVTGGTRTSGPRQEPAPAPAPTPAPSPAPRVLPAAAAGPRPSTDAIREKFRRHPVVEHVIGTFGGDQLRLDPERERPAKPEEPT
ncbi:MAG: DNA polymerase III subunit gamma/tau [Deltaproteobacteria bacterium]|nr:DNA polymerase III subunit gamma/tau [Deltaproteobacteria bacterium]